MKRLLALTALLTTLTAATWAACSSPTGVAGQVVYAATQNMMVYCDGTNWISMSGGANVSIGGNVNNPAGNDYELQFKSGTGFGSSSGLTWNNATSTLAATNIAGTLTTAAQPNITSIGTLTGLTVNGTISTTALYVNGVAITGSASGDRITSGTATVQANQSTGYISLTTGATTWGYLGSSATYVPNLNSAQISATHVSMTLGQVAGTSIGAMAGGGGNYIVSGTTRLTTTSAGSITFVTNNAQAMGIDSSGRVGIGTANPGAPLDVQNPVATSAVLGRFLLPGQGNGNLSQIILGKDATTNYAQGALTYSYNSTTPANSFISLGNSTTNSAMLNILGNGNVGIGVTNPVNRLVLNDLNGYYVHIGGGNSIVNGTRPWLSVWNSTDPASAVYGWAWYDSVADGSLNLYRRDGSTTGSQVMNISRGTGNIVIAGTLTQNSDARLKTDIKPIPTALEKLALVNGVTFHWKDKSRDQKEQMGVIAQDVQKAFPQLVNADVSSTLSVNYPGMIAPLIEAVKELKARNEALTAKVDALEQQIKTMQSK